MDKPQLSFEISELGEYLEVVVKATNGIFAGTTTGITIVGEQLIEMGNQLQGFPKNIWQVIEKTFGICYLDEVDYRENIIGTNTEINRNPYVRLTFRCIDSMGHTAVDVFLIEESGYGIKFGESEESRGKVYLEIRFEPASLDRFSMELSELGKRKEGKAVLTGYK